MCTITIFTPTYNRAKLLPRLYKSLQQQNSSVFEWIIVDDGSQDNTREVIQEFINENVFKIIYVYQDNKGKHYAINKGVKLAKGELFWIVDSDDYLPKTALSLVLNKYAIVANNPKFCGVAGRRININGKIVGNEFGQDISSNSIDIRFKHKVNGDLVEVFKTSVMKDFPFPEINNEKFCPEALIWNRIAQKYKLLFFNTGIYVADYQPEGLTSKIIQIRMNSPIASMLTYSELASYKIPLIKKAKALINFWRFSLNSTKSFTYKLNLLNNALSFMCFPLGFLMYLRDKYNIK